MSVDVKLCEHVHFLSCYISEEHIFIPFEMFNCYFTLNYFMINTETDSGRSTLANLLIILKRMLQKYNDSAISVCNKSFCVIVSQIVTMRTTTGTGQLVGSLKKF